MDENERSDDMLDRRRRAHPVVEYGDGEYNRADGAYNRTAARRGEEQELVHAAPRGKEANKKTRRKQLVKRGNAVRPRVGKRDINQLEAVCFRML